MALGDVNLFDDVSYPGDTQYNVAAGTVASIKAGEFVLKDPGAIAATAWTVNSATKPVVGTDFIAGLATTTSTETAAAAGTVRVAKLVAGISFLVNPLVAATWNTQAKYDALVGKRVLWNVANNGIGSAQTLLASDGATFGFVVLPLEIAKFPAKVRIAFRTGLDYLA